MTVKDAIGDLEEAEITVSDRTFINAPEGRRRIYNHWSSVRARPTDQKGTDIKPDQPARTVMRRNYLQHYALPRELTPRERARLFSIPDAFRFHGTVNEINDGLGNGVPLELATAIARAVRNSYDHVLVN